MHDKLVEIVRLTEDSSFSHAARMVSIRTIAREILKGLSAPQGAQGGAKTGNPLPKQSPAIPTVTPG